MVITSSLPRSLETTGLIFREKKLPILVLDEARENNYHHPCNERRTRSAIIREYPAMDCSRLASEHDEWFARGDRKEMLDRFLSSAEQQHVAIVSHCDFIRDYLLHLRTAPKRLDNCEIFCCKWRAKPETTQCLDFDRN
jgi:broad specificity phosphatase PhoE